MMTWLDGKRRQVCVGHLLPGRLSAWPQFHLAPPAHCDAPPQSARIDPRPRALLHPHPAHPAPSPSSSPPCSQGRRRQGPVWQHDRHRICQLHCQEPGGAPGQSRPAGTARHRAGESGARGRWWTAPPPSAQDAAALLRCSHTCRCEPARVCANTVARWGSDTPPGTSIPAIPENKLKLASTGGAAHPLTGACVEQHPCGRPRQPAQVYPEHQLPGTGMLNKMPKRCIKRCYTTLYGFVRYY
jgi:hypothetical protein